MFAKILVLALFASAALAIPEHPTEGYTNCLEGAGPELLSVEVEGCTITPCVFVKGNSYKVTVKATSDRVTTSLPYEVTARIFGLDIVLFEGEACDFLTEGECPTSVGGTFTFEKALEITGQYPNLETDITATVNDDTGAVGICASFRIKTQE